MAGGDSATQGLKALKAKGTAVSICNWSIKDDAAKQDKTGISFLVKPSGEQLRVVADLIDQDKIKLVSLIDGRARNVR
jgi:hypothetical protein